jgi:type IV pilus assembly protein PilM
VTEPELVSHTVKRLTSHLKIKEKAAATSISGYEVMIKKIELPTMTEEELDTRMHVELGQYIPYNIDEVEVDYQVMDIARDRPNFMEVLLVAAKKESVKDCINLVKLSGLEPAVIDVDFFALSNAYEATYGIKGNENIALLDIGASKSTLNILNQGVPLFTRDIPIGGHQITDRIREQLGVAYDEAETIKLGQISEQIPTEEIEETFVNVVGNWVTEFKRAIDFYYSNYPGNNIEKIYLSGGSCRVPGLCQLFRENTDIEVEIFNPFTRIDFDPKVFDSAYVEYIGPQMAISLGLALRKSSIK